MRSVLLLFALFWCHGVKSGVEWSYWYDWGVIGNNECFGHTWLVLVL